MTSTRHDVELVVNGVPARARAEARTSLADLLRDEIGLKGTKLGCEHGVCGCCTVLLDGAPVRSCIVLAAQADGHDVTTVEGLSPAPGELSVLQEAFCEAHGLQCGYCTAGMLIAAEALLRANPTPTDHEIDDAIGGNICRCTGYGQIRDAIRLASRRLAGDEVASAPPAPEGAGATRGNGNAVPAIPAGTRHG
jgi:aerobic carbon-monoxide dehydrogenase small subunit